MNSHKYSLSAAMVLLLFYSYVPEDEDDFEEPAAVLSVAGKSQSNNS